MKKWEGKGRDRKEEKRNEREVKELREVKGREVNGRKWQDNFMQGLKFEFEFKNQMLSFPLQNIAEQLLLLSLILFFISE